MSVKQLSLAFIAGLSLVSAAAFADSGTQPVQPPVQDDIQVRCKFFGSGSGKDGSWSMGCRAEAKIDRPQKQDDFRWIANSDDYLKVRCGDGDGDMDDRPLYEGPALHGLAPSLTQLREIDLLITGNKTTSPLIRIVDFDRHLDGDHDRDRDDEHQALLTFVRRGIQFALPGVCEIERKHVPVAPPALN